MKDTAQLGIRFHVPERGWALVGGEDDHDFGTTLRLMGADGRFWNVFVAVMCMDDGSLDAEVGSVTEIVA